MTFDNAEHPRDTTGQFTEKTQSAPEATLEPPKPLTESIAAYLRDYDQASEAYEEDGGGYGPDADAAYEAWEDFQTGTSGRTYAMLEEAKTEIERLQAELAKAQTGHRIPEVLRTRIETDYQNGDDEPTLYVPEDGHSGDGYFDAVAFVDGEAAVKYTLDPQGDITGYACT